MLIKCLLFAFITHQALALTEKVIYDIENAELLFQEFIQTYEKRYESYEEYRRRLSIFIENLKSINERNNQSESVIYGITQFADMTIEELANMLPGLTIDANSVENEYEFEDLGDTPPSWDWREHGAVGPIKNQGHCGSCWIFSATALVEGQYGKKHGQVEPLSEQEVLDCGVWPQKGGPCGGGNPASAIDTMVRLGGWMPEQDYPYEARKLQCKYQRDKAIVETSEATMLRVMSEEDLQSIVYSSGPVSITVFVNQSNNAWYSYKGGIATAESLTCFHHTYNDHAVNIVGYGSENGQDYWIIKNSWSENWGEDGYMRIERGKNACNILDFVMTTTAV